MKNEQITKSSLKKVKELIQNVQEMTPEEFQETLNKMLRFHRYSFYNQIILCFAGCSQVAGYKKWKELGRTIKKGGIFIANLSKGILGEDVASLLGSLLISKFELAAMKRASLPEEKRSDFFLYIDEFQSFTTQSFVDILSQARKYRLNLILTHQYLAQVDERIRNAVLGNVGTIVVFRVGPEDAQVLEKEFRLNYSWLDLINSPPYEIYFKVMENGRISGPLVALAYPLFLKILNRATKIRSKSFQDIAMVETEKK